MISKQTTIEMQESLGEIMATFFDRLDTDDERRVGCAMMAIASLELMFDNDGREAVQELVAYVTQAMNDDDAALQSRH